MSVCGGKSRSRRATSGPGDVATMPAKRLPHRVGAVHVFIGLDMSCACFENPCLVFTAHEVCWVIGARLAYELVEASAGFRCGPSV